MLRLWRRGPFIRFSSHAPPFKLISPVIGSSFSVRLCEFPTYELDRIIFEIPFFPSRSSSLPPSSLTSNNCSGFVLPLRTPVKSRKQNAPPPFQVPFHPAPSLGISTFSCFPYSGFTLYFASKFLFKSYSYAKRQFFFPFLFFSILSPLPSLSFRITPTSLLLCPS